MTAIASEIKPGIARVAHIEGILLADENLKAHVGPKDAKIPRRDGAGTLEFHRLSMAVTLKLMVAGKEPLQTKAAEVGDYARVVLDEQAEDAVLAKSNADASVAETATPPQTPTVTPAPVAPAVPVAAEAAPRKQRAAKTSAAPAAPSAAPAAPAASVDPVLRDETPTAETPAVAAAAPVSTKRGPRKQEASASQEADKSTDSQPTEPPVNVNLAVYSLLVSTQELAERDTQPGAQGRRSALAAVAKSYRDVVAR